MSQDVESFLVFFKGSAIAYLEGPFNGQATYNPVNVLEIDNVTAVPGSGGTVMFTAVIRNIGRQNIQSPAIFFDYPRYGTNITHAGVVWHGLPYYLCDAILSPNEACNVALSLGPQLGLNIGIAYPLAMVVEGITSTPLPVNVTTTTTNRIILRSTSTTQFSTLNQTAFVFRKTFEVNYPGSGPNPAWMDSFIGVVNSHRNGIRLVENHTMDSFAHTRFLTDVSNYSVSDYGFDRQAAAYFIGTGKAYTEEILYPSSFSPAGFASYIEQSAPGHWVGLTNAGYTQYGYYLGTGPAIVVSDCALTEITSRNVNITQAAIEDSCHYAVQNEIYLVIVLSS